MPVGTKAVLVRHFGGPYVLNHATQLDIRDPEAGEVCDAKVYNSNFFVVNWAQHALHTATTQVLIALECAGVNPVDTYICSGNYSTGSKLPYIPGTHTKACFEYHGLL